MDFMLDQQSEDKSLAYRLRQCNSYLHSHFKLSSKLYKQPLSPLCDLCRQLLKSFQADNTLLDGTHQPIKRRRNQLKSRLTCYTAAGLEKNASKGCSLCQIMLDYLPPIILERNGAIREDNLQVALTLYPHRETNGQFWFDGEVSFFFAASNFSEYKMIKLCEIGALERNDSSFRFLNTGDNENVMSESVKNINIWIQRCILQHSSCHKSNPMSFRPSRLLQIKSADGRMKVQLCYGEDLTQIQDLRYATLSHCWGNAESLRLNESLIPQFRQSISLSSLPRTFRDAAILINLLGLTYLWIDSLCIVQDSKEDWLRESALMGTIYGQAFLNIAATASRDDHGGLFDSCQSLHSRSTCVLAPKGPEISNRRFFCYDDSPWEELVLKSPWKARAWTFQEAALAPRTVHFGRGQLLWECPELRASENFPDGTTGFFYLGESERRSLNSRLLRPDAGTIESRISTWEADTLWADIVFQYSQGALTHLSDKLVAISAVARAFASARKIDERTYLAGIWKDTLPASLLWHTRVSEGFGHISSTGGPQLRTGNYRAPSWSWAALEGIVKLAKRTARDNPIVTILDASTTAEEDVLGGVKSGNIRLIGNMLKATMIRVEEESSTHAHLNMLVPYLSPDNGPSPLTNGLKVYVEPHFDDAHRHANFFYAQPSVHEDVFLLPIIQPLGGDPADASAAETIAFDGLILAPTQRKGEFVRTGIFHVVGKTSCLTFEIGLLSKSIPADNYEEFDGVEKYTVNII